MFHDFLGESSSKSIFSHIDINSLTGSSVATLIEKYFERNGIFLIKSLSAPPIAEKQPLTTKRQGFAFEPGPA